MIPYGRHDITQSDIEAVVEVLKSNFLTQGPVVPCFEEVVSTYCGARHAVAVNSATSALHIACLAAGVGPGDILWTSPNTFVASANCALYCGASVDFVDIDPRTYNISVERLQEKLERAEHTGSLPKVVIPVHFAGQSCNMKAIAELAERYGFQVIEDASHAIGGLYLGETIGNCRYSCMTVFSFHPVKIITTGEGGIVLTNNDELYNKMLRLRSHGITRNPALMTEEPHGPWYYQQIELGFNYRMTDIQAALGRNQMGRVNEFIHRRNLLSARYDEALYKLPLVLPWRDPATYSSQHLYVVRLRKDACERGHKEVFECLRQIGIGVNLHYIPVYLQPYYRRLGFTIGYCPEAELYYNEAISIPLYHGLSEDDQDRVVEAIKRVVS